MGKRIDVVCGKTIYHLKDARIGRRNVVGTGCGPDANRYTIPLSSVKAIREYRG